MIENFNIFLCVINKYVYICVRKIKRKIKQNKVLNSFNNYSLLSFKNINVFLLPINTCNKSIINAKSCELYEKLIIKD